MFQVNQPMASNTHGIHQKKTGTTSIKALIKELTSVFLMALSRTFLHIAFIFAHLRPLACHALYPNWTMHKGLLYARARRKNMVPLWSDLY